MKIRITPALAALTLATLPLTAMAGKDSGFYIGGSLGNASLDYSESHSAGDIDFDDDDTAYKVFAGYNFGLVPLIDIAAEVSYVDFGKHEGEVANITNNKLEVEAWTAVGLVGFNLGPIGVFGKMGLATWDGDISGPLNGSDDGTDPLYGLGAKLQLGSLAVRAEYELFDLDKIDIDYFSVGASYTF